MVHGVLTRRENLAVRSLNVSGKVIANIFAVFILYVVSLNDILPDEIQETRGPRPAGPAGPVWVLGPTKGPAQHVGPTGTTL